MSISIIRNNKKYVYYQINDLYVLDVRINNIKLFGNHLNHSSIMFKKEAHFNYSWVITLVNSAITELNKDINEGLIDDEDFIDFINNNTNYYNINKYINFTTCPVCGKQLTFLLTSQCLTGYNIEVSGNSECKVLNVSKKISINCLNLISNPNKAIFNLVDYHSLYVVPVTTALADKTLCPFTLNNFLNGCNVLPENSALCFANDTKTVGIWQNIKTGTDFLITTMIKGKLPIFYENIEMQEYFKENYKHIGHIFPAQYFLICNYENYLRLINNELENFSRLDYSLTNVFKLYLKQELLHIEVKLTIDTGETDRLLVHITTEDK